MVYSDGLYQPPILELARTGNFRAIAHWLNQALSPYGIRASVGKGRPGCLKVLVELPQVDQHSLPSQWRDHLVRFICHRIWQLNSGAIDGVRIAARFPNEQRVLWEQSVRVVSPARRQRLQQSHQIKTRVHQTARRRSQLKMMRALLMSGAPLFAFIFGCVLGFSKAPVEQINAVASSNRTDAKSPGTEQPSGRPDRVRAALEMVPVIKHDRVADPHDPTVTLMFSGDVTLAEAFAERVGKDHDHAFAAMDEYRKADLSMVNLENPLTRATIPLPDKQFNFKADPDSVQVLEKGGVDLVTLANNHTMDFKESGLVETIETLDKANILHMGAGRDETEARRPEIVDVKGQRVAYLAYYGADLHAATDRSAGTNYADEARISADIKSIRDQVDWIVINFHWGEELATHPAEWQIDLAHFTVDQGADLVVGHHPHVLQGAEIYKGRPIAYSLGNFIFGGNSRSDYDTAVLQVALKDKQMKVEFLPVEVRDYQPKVVSGDRANDILRQINDLSSGFKQPMQSPAILDARQVPAGESPIPAPAAPGEIPTPSPTPSDASNPTVPTPAPRTFPFDPYAPPPAEMDAPPQSTPAPTDTTVPPADSTTPFLPTEPSAPAPPLLPDANTPSSEPPLPADMVVPSASPAAPPAGTTAPGEPPISTGNELYPAPANSNNFSNPNAQPASPDGALVPDSQPATSEHGDARGETAPESRTAQDSTLNPFVNSPSHTSIHPATAAPQPSMAREWNSPSAGMPTSETPTIQPADSAAEEANQEDVEQEQAALNQLVVPRQPLAKPSAPNQASSEPEGVGQIPNVALMAAAVW